MVIAKLFRVTYVTALAGETNTAIGVDPNAAASRNAVQSPVAPTTGFDAPRHPLKVHQHFSLSKNFSLYETSINDPLFGQLLSTQGARVMLWNARITF